MLVSGIQHSNSVFVYVVKCLPFLCGFWKLAEMCPAQKDQSYQNTCFSDGSFHKLDSK